MKQKLNLKKKYFCLVLHTHIPYVLNHGTWPHGTDWLYEAAAETYLPLLGVLRRLENEGLNPGLTISLTPVLVEQLKSQKFSHSFVDYLTMKLESTVNDYLYFQQSGQQELMPLALFWRDWYEKIFRLFVDEFKSDLVSALARFQGNGLIEIITSGATHGYLPLLSRDESVVHQVKQGNFVYKKYFGRQPEGFWLPECAYRPGYSWKSPLGESEPYLRKGVDEILSQESLAYFFVDGHLLKGGEARGVYLEKFPALRYLWERYREKYKAEPLRPQDPYQPYLAYPSNLTFLARDELSGKQVWSRSQGYPGDGHYLEFHKKHFPGGLRYWKITASSSDLADKHPYNYQEAQERVEAHAEHFVWLLNETLKNHESGIITSLYDTELLGHWWFEGPEWLYQVVKKLSKPESVVKPATASRCLQDFPSSLIISLPEGSWGEGGYHWIWLNEETSWVWSRIYELEKKCFSWLQNEPRCQKTNPRLIKLFFQEKFLLESSDWPFLISTMTARDYGEARASLHFERGRQLLQLMERDSDLTPGELFFLDKIEEEDSVFREIILPDGNIL
jgi:1,4-alpha-glucan branching enzyme